jgi:hypothetical protein
MLMPTDGWGWAGDVGHFLALHVEEWLVSMRGHHERLTHAQPSGLQLAVWRSEYDDMRSALATCVKAMPEAGRWGLIFEYELPFEGGRRPDVVALAGSAIVVLEFKSALRFYQAHIDQVEAYARDLSEYHEASHGRRVVPALVMRGVPPLHGRVAATPIVDPSGIDRVLLENALPGEIDLAGWLRAAYAPLPTLVSAARRIFRHEPLPHVRRAMSRGVPATVDLVARLASEAEAARRRMLILVTGVPGAGKTLVGLRSVYEGSDEEGSATFLSGNGPLVEVLQDALSSRVFVRDLHAFIKTYGLQGKIPKQHLIVFDEAQRAWDQGQMARKHGVARSEPELLVEAGERVEDWCVLVGLVGEGQEIHTGEEGGLKQWREAISAGSRKWEVHCPAHVAEHFGALPVETHAELNASLRSHRAVDLHDWVRLLLRGSIEMAVAKGRRAQAEDGYPLYLTRDLDEARDYARARYENEPEKRYGLLTSSHAWRYFAHHGIRSGFLDLQRLKVARWFNADPEDPNSGCALEVPLTEFQCQGLEVDLPIVCWGPDYRWEGGAWRRTAIRRKPPLENPDQILENAYRVLLTRGRDACVIFLPADGELDDTAAVLLAAGVQPLPAPDVITAGAPIVGSCGTA